MEKIIYFILIILLGSYSTFALDEVKLNKEEVSSILSEKVGIKSSLGECEISYNIEKNTLSFRGFDLRGHFYISFYLNNKENVKLKLFNNDHDDLKLIMVDYQSKPLTDMEILKALKTLSPNTPIGAISMPTVRMLTIMFLDSGEIAQIEMDDHNTMRVIQCGI